MTKSKSQHDSKIKKTSSWHSGDLKKTASLEDQFFSERAVTHRSPAMGRFTVTRVPEVGVNLTRNADVRSGTDQSDQGSRVMPISIFDEPTVQRKTRSTPEGTHQLSFDGSYDTHTLTLYEDDLQEGDTVLRVVKKTVDSSSDSGNAQKANLGTFFGVFLPCCQNIVGVIYFLRFPWIVGCGGIMEAFIIVFICNMMSVTTALSMSAIATNGRVTAGGTYFMISRSLGPSFGGSVGLLFFLGTSISVAMYYVGTIEVLLTYIAPEMAVFKSTGDNPHAEANNCRLYGTALLLVMSIVVFIGVKCVSRFALFAIVFLVAALLSVFVGLGMAAAGAGETFWVCALGERLVRYSLVHNNGSWECHKQPSGPLYSAYCHKHNDSMVCDDYFEKNEAKLIPAIPGFSMRLLEASFYNFYTKAGNIPGTDVKANPSRDIVTDITTSFVFLFSIYFPSITGVESGSNYSGDLRDAQKSIPRGTLTAVAVTSTIYLSSVVLMGSSVEGSVLRDKFGDSIGISGDLLLSIMAWPTKWVVLTGALTATVGAGMQALAGAPRLLQAIGEDQILPALGFFSVKWHGEPIRGLFMTYLIAELGILIAFLDYVAPIVTMFFLMCYGFINFAVTLQSLVDTPHWRPSYRCYHWTITLLGTALCVTTMFVCDWIYALVAIVLAFLLYEYIEYKGAEKEWGDGCTGLSMSAAIFALNKLNKEFHHTKNWRPQILVLLKMADVGDDLTQFSVDDSRLVMLSSMLKEGRGLTMYGTVIKGKLSEMSKEQEELRTRISECLSNSGVKGFVEVVINPSVTDGMSCMIQSAGLGALRPNTIILGWPHDWIEKRSLTSYQIFLETMRNVALTKNATIILKACSFPSHLARMSGTIDVWWVVNDGGMLLLLAHLLRRSKTWGKCKLRLFSVAQEEDNTVQIKKDLKTYLYELRVEGTVEVVEMAADDMSAYVYERTLKMEQRTRMLQSLIRKKTSIVPVPLGSQRKILEKKEVQSVLENARSAFDFGKRKEDFSSQTDMISSPQKAPPSSENLRHMNTAIGLNKLIKERSSQADLVILNLPCVPESSKGQANYMSFLEVLTESIERILLVRGTGNEVITAFN